MTNFIMEKLIYIWNMLTDEYYVVYEFLGFKSPEIATTDLYIILMLWVIGMNVIEIIMFNEDKIKAWFKKLVNNTANRCKKIFSK